MVEVIHSLAADVRVPDFGVKFHYWRSKWVVIRYLNIDNVVSALIWCARRAFERALEMCQILPITHRIGEYV